MNSVPRPEDALARKLREMQDAIRALQRRIRALEARVTVLEADE